MKRMKRAYLWSSVVALGVSGIAAAQSGPSLDELLELKPAVPTDATRDPAPTGDASVPEAVIRDDDALPLDAAVERRLTAGEAGDLFQELIAEMGEASQRLERQLDPGTVTQRIQASVVAKLDKLISDAEQSGGGGDGQGDPQAREQDRGSQQQAGQRQQSGAGEGQGSSAGGAPMSGRQATPDRAIDEQRQEWGNLPPRLRDELLEGQNERFSPVYRELTEMYYRRLAEEGR